MCVWSEGDPASGQLKVEQAVLTGPCLRPVMDHRTRPVPIPEDLDLSGIDRTLGGSVRSLPPERPVSGSRAVSGLFSPFPNPSRVGNYLTTAIPCFALHLAFALASATASCTSIARQPRTAVLLPRRATATPRRPPRAQACRVAVQLAFPEPSSAPPQPCADHLAPKPPRLSSSSHQNLPSRPPCARFARRRACPTLPALAPVPRQP